MRFTREEYPRIAHEGVKLHRRTLVLDGRTYTVLGLRPANRERFAVNHFHDTWHVVSDRAGALLLAKLMWALSYERSPGTLVLIDRPFLDPNPFDAEKSPPIVLTPHKLTVFDAGTARELRRKLPLSAPSEGTVRYRAPGLAAAAEDPDAWLAARPPRPYHWANHRYTRPTVDVRSGVLHVGGSADELREWAVRLTRTNPYVVMPHTSGGMDYDHLGDDYSLEVQVFADYRLRVSAARQARAQLEAEEPEIAAASPDEANPVLWDRSARIHRRMRLDRVMARKRRAGRAGQADRAGRTGRAGRGQPVGRP